MKGDFTRDTFQAEKHYQGVLMQQGRVQLDADWNEQAALAARRAATGMADMLGDCGGPADNAAFGAVTAVAQLPAAQQTEWFGKLTAAEQAAITAKLVAGGDFLLTAGRYYVDGMQCELERPVLFGAQPDRFVADALAPGKSYLLFLDVWLRHVTALEDGGVREPALGGPDTATRAKTVWQVRALEIPPPAAGIACTTPVNAFTDLLQPASARLTANTAAVNATDDPCDVPESAGYKGLENQLYRVEIHAGTGAPGGPTWKWSRENGSIVTALTRINGTTLTVASLGADARLGFGPGDWVELLDDALELEGQPGQLLQVADVNAAQRTLTLAAAAAPLVALAQFPDGVNPARHPKLRRWEGAAAVVVNSFLPLESGVQIRFDNAAAKYRTGEYWQIPARAATATALAGDIEWPRALNASGQPDSQQPRSQPPRGIAHHYCRLGLAQVAAGGALTLTDCRCLHPALTAVPRLFYVSGDGQEVPPDLTQPTQFFKLPRPLIVGVANAQCLPAPLVVRFTITAGAGRVAPAGVLPASAQTSDVAIDAGGLAGCDFYLEANNSSQQVTARLLDAGGKAVSLPLIFNANLSLASRVAYQPGQCDLLKNAHEVQTALDLLCAAMGHGGCCLTVGPGGDFATLDVALETLLPKAADICLCFLPGEHVAKNPRVVGDGKRDLRVRLSGCGRATRLRLERPALFANLTAVTVRDLEISFPRPTEKSAGLLDFDGCGEVTLAGCQVSGLTDGCALVRVRDANRVRIADNELEAALGTSLRPTVAVFKKGKAELLADLFRNEELPEFNRALKEAGATLEKLDAVARTALRDGLQSVLREAEIQSVLSQGEILSFAKLSLALAAEAPQAGGFASALWSVRSSAVKARAGLAVVVGEVSTPAVVGGLNLAASDDDDFLLLADNTITGVVCLLGQPEGAALTPAEVEQLSGALKKPTIQIAGLLGGLQMRGNQLTRLAVAEAVIAQVRETLKGGTGTISGVLGRCALTDNTFADSGSLVVAQQVSLLANKFTLSAQPVTPGVLTNVPVVLLGTSLAENAVFVGNQGRGRNLGWRNLARLSDQAANVNVLVT